MSDSQAAKSARGNNRFPISLNQPLDHKLLGYSLAAGAAGVGLLALPAGAQIVYTAANQEIPPGGGLNLDLNNDGITDFNINNALSYGCLGPECVFQNLLVSPTAPNRVMVTSGGRSNAQALPILARVGPKENFGSAFVQMDRCDATRTSYYLSGSFLRGSHYLGLAFSINGQIHYGWARFRVTVVGRRCSAHAVLTGYAYQTIPGEPIRAGEMVNHLNSEWGEARGSLGALALGSAGLAARQREGAQH